MSVAAIEPAFKGNHQMTAAEAAELAELRMLWSKTRPGRPRFVAKPWRYLILCIVPASGRIATQRVFR